jgi:LPS-assembly protein
VQDYKYINKLLIVIVNIVILLFSPSLCLSEETKDTNKSGFKLNTSEPTLIYGDDVYYDKTHSLVIGIGKVRIKQNNRILLADYVEYSINENKVKAHGNLSLLNENGDILFADNAEFKNGFEQGEVNSIKARLVDNSLFASNKAILKSGKQIELEKASYTPCKICESKAPQWQIKAKEVKIDNEKQVVKYKNAYFEVYGIPIIYTPFFSHPTPYAERKSGFLIPTYKFKSAFGPMIEIPYYFNIAPDKDLILSTQIYAKDLPLVSAKYRQLTKYGQYNLSGSFAYPEHYKQSEYARRKRVKRGHAEGTSDLKLNDDWRAGFNFKQASDKTYLRTYQISEEDYLTSRLYIDRYNENHALFTESIYFQGLRAKDNQRQIPVILPQVKYVYTHKPNFLHSTYNFETNIVNLEREQGIDSRRVTFINSFNIPYITNLGHVFNLNLSYRNDIYMVDNVPFTRYGAAAKYNGNAYRSLPEAKLEWKYPLMKQFASTNLVVEPIANMIFSSYNKSSYKIPNEDSQYIELSDYNLFKSNHYTGFDKVEKGTRFNYGVNMSAYRGNNSYINLLFGQNSRLKKDEELGFSTAMYDRYSDYVGRLILKPNKYIDFYHRVRLDRSTLAALRNEIGSSLNVHPFTLNTIYTSYKGKRIQSAIPISNRKEIYSDLKIALTNSWAVGANARKNLSKKDPDAGLKAKKLLSAGGNVKYHSDCIDVIFSMNRDFTTEQSDHNLRKPNTTYFMNIILKNIN